MKDFYFRTRISYEYFYECLESNFPPRYNRHLNLTTTSILILVTLPPLSYPLLPVLFPKVLAKRYLYLLEL